MEKKKKSNSVKSKNTDVEKSITKNTNKKATVSKEVKNNIKKNTVKNSKKVTSKKSTTQKKANVVVTESASTELKKLSTILVSVVGIVCVFYIITVFVTKGNSDLKYQSSDEVSEISYTDILASDILKKDGSYYVLVKDNEDEYIDLFETYISSYVSSDDHLDVYSVDLNDALNKKYIAEENNLSSDNLKFKGTVLLKISNGNIENTYDNSDSINDHLKSLVLE